MFIASSQCLGRFWGISVHESNRLHVDLLRSGFKFSNSSPCPEVLELEPVLLQTQPVIYKYQFVFLVHCFLTMFGEILGHNVMRSKCS
jgi:hypothetical protein